MNNSDDEFNDESKNPEPEQKPKKPISTLEAISTIATIATLLLTSVKGMGIELKGFDAISTCLSSGLRVMAGGMLKILVQQALTDISKKSISVGITTYRILATLLDLSNLLSVSQAELTITNEAAVAIMNAPDVYVAGKKAGLTVDSQSGNMMIANVYATLRLHMSKPDADTAVFALANDCADNQQNQKSYNSSSTSEFPLPSNRGPVTHPSRMSHFKSNKNTNNTKHCVHCAKNKTTENPMLHIAPYSHNTEQCNHAPTLQADGTMAPAKPYAIHNQPRNNQNRQPRQQSTKGSYIDQLNNNIQ
jgi:hypothetical protein